MLKSLVVNLGPYTGKGVMTVMHAEGEDNYARGVRNTPVIVVYKYTSGITRRFGSLGMKGYYNRILLLDKASEHR